jgi:hypothetical protein
MVLIRMLLIELEIQICMCIKMIFRVLLQNLSKNFDDTHMT